MALLPISTHFLVLITIISGVATLNCTTNQINQCKLAVTHAQQNNVNDTELCLALQSGADCLGKLKDSCKGNFDWSSALTDYQSQLSRLNCSDGALPQCDTARLIKCMNLAITADGEIDPSTQCMNYSQAADCIADISNDCRFTPEYINIDSVVSRNVHLCQEGLCNQTASDLCTQTVKNDSSSRKSYQELCWDSAQAATCLRPYEPGCWNNSRWIDIWKDLNNVANQCGLPTGCSLRNLSYCMVNVLGISLDGSTVPSSICQNYDRFKTCWDKESPSCVLNPIYQSLETVANQYHRCQTKCNDNEFGECVVSVIWVRNIPGFSSPEQLNITCSNLTTFTDCYLRMRGACYNDFSKPSFGLSLQMFDKIAAASNDLCQESKQFLATEDAIDCLNRSDVQVRMKHCNKAIFRKLPYCGKLKTPDVNCTHRAITETCGQNYSSTAAIAVDVNTAMYKMFTAFYPNNPCTTTHSTPPTTSSSKSASSLSTHNHRHSNDDSAQWDTKITDKC